MGKLTLFGQQLPEGGLRQAMSTGNCFRNRAQLLDAVAQSWWLLECFSRCGTVLTYGKMLSHNIIAPSILEEPKFA